jgi:hypothetical protein
MTPLPREMMPRALLPSCWVFLIAQATAPEPKALPRPVQTMMPLCIPLARRDVGEEALLRRGLHLHHMQWCAETGVPLWVDDCPEATDPSLQGDIAIAAEETELDKQILRIMGVRGIAHATPPMPLPLAPRVTVTMCVARPTRGLAL